MKYMTREQPFDIPLEINTEISVSAYMSDDH